MTAFNKKAYCLLIVKRIKLHKLKYVNKNKLKCKLIVSNIKSSIIYLKTLSEIYGLPGQFVVHRCSSIEPCTTSLQIALQGLYC